MEYISDEVLNKVVDELTIRADKARKARALIGTTIITVAVILSSFISYRLTNTFTIMGFNNSGVLASRFSNGFNDTAGIRDAINQQLLKAFPESSKNNLWAKAFIGSGGSETTVKTEHEVEKVVTKAEKDEALSNVNQLVGYYSRVASIENGRPINKTDTTYSSLISTLALSAGAVGFVLYILQIAVSFIRYYSRLAELYDSQKTALVASDGNVETAKTLMSILSNNHIGLGKEPVSIYGKALDVIGEVAKSKKD
ncbi:hypothetical protein ACUF8D_003102 [Klebsiella aerogenes]